MKLHILVADSGEHSAKCQNSLFSLLENTDFIVSKHTSNLNEAVGLVLSRQYDILLCINRAPEYIAVKLLRLIGGTEQKIPTIIISEQDDSQRMRECFLLGAIDFLAEPVPPEDLISALTRASAMIHEHLIESEYRIAVEQALAALPQSEELVSILDKLQECRIFAGGYLLTFPHKKRYDYYVSLSAIAGDKINRRMFYVLY